MMRQFDNSVKLADHLEEELASLPKLRNVEYPHPMCGHIVEYLPQHWHDDHRVQEVYNRKELFSEVGEKLGHLSLIEHDSLSDGDRPTQDVWIP